MPEVVRLRNNYGHLVEVDHVPGPNPEHGEVLDAPGRLVSDMDEYRSLMGLSTDPPTPLGPDVEGYHWVLEPSGQLRGWPKATWDLVQDKPVTKAKGR